MMDLIKGPLTSKGLFEDDTPFDLLESDVNLTGEVMAEYLQHDGFKDHGFFVYEVDYENVKNYYKKKIYPINIVMGKIYNIITTDEIKHDNDYLVAYVVRSIGNVDEFFIKLRSNDINDNRVVNNRLRTIELKIADVIEGRGNQKILQECRNELRFLYKKIENNEVMM